jgi:O-succinylbenzoate synthase
MPFRLQFRRYRLPLRTTIRTAHEVWSEREGLILKLENESGRTGFGEIAPIPAFGTESVAEAEATLRSLGERPADTALFSLPPRLGCLRQAVSAARDELTAHRPEEPTEASGVPYRAIAALVPAGRVALEQITVKAEAGFRVFKWKVGVGAVVDELALLDDVCAALPSGAKLRLDANGAWDRRTAERWLERCAERPIEYVEQPCLAPPADGSNAAKKIEDTLLGLANDFPTPIALDESLVGEGDVERWVAAGWPGWYVVKPSLLGDAKAALGRLSAAKATVVFSSALETAVGARTALRLAFSWPGEAKALGFGVWPLFQDPSFDGPAAAPFIRKGDIARLNPEAIWNALS